jgi:endoglucanase
MMRLTRRLRRRPTALLLAGVLACAAALVGLVAGPAEAAGGHHTITVINPGNQVGTVDIAASLQIQATDSVAGQTLTYAATGLPAGLSINSSTGLITGTPTTIGTSNVTVTAKAGVTGSAAFTWTISASNTVTVTSPGNQVGSVGTAASLQIQATDSAAGQTLTYAATGLPAGLSISSTGLITGTPTTAGASTVTVTVTDSTGASGSATFTWTISAPAPQLQVSGNKLVNSATGQQVVLHGVDRSGGEYACVNGTGVWDGPMDQTAVSAIKSWNVNAVRVPLNEACWNGESYVNPAYAGANYISAVTAYVNLLNSNGIVAILDLHWTDGQYTGPSAGCTSAQAVCQKPMPDSAQAIPFWTSVANTFKGNDAVIFDLFNEPYASRATGSAVSGWQCWLNGGTCPGISYQVAGMQAMVNAVRSTGATNVIMVGGEEYANDLGTPGSTSDPSILTNLPTDPDHDIAVSWHSYNFNACNTQPCWTSQVQPVIAQVPVIAGEIGENDCASGYVTPLMTWLDSQQTSYLAWAWNADFKCRTGPGLISDYGGTPTGYGAGVKSHLLSVGG